MNRSGRYKLAVLVLGCLTLSGAAVEVSAQEGLEVRIAPAEFLIANQARHVGLGYQGASPYFDLVLQTVYFINRGEVPLTLTGATIEVLATGEVLQESVIPTAEIARTQGYAAAIAGMNFPAALDIHYSASSTLPEGVAFSPTLTLAPNSAGLVDDNYLVLRALPDEVRVTARATDEAGDEVVATRSIPVRQYDSPNSYIFPLEAGEWYILAYPGLEGHHRWTAVTEHGYDITMVDDRGSWAHGDLADWRTGDVPEWERWYAYDKKVLAAADGTVVRVVDDVEFPLSFWNRRQGESLADYRKRIGGRQMELFMAEDADPAAVAGGNHILIEHAGGEYSYYAHLAFGRIRVEVGERVTQGQHIAGLGGTGEVPAVHLHFQVNDSPELLTARTLPVKFTDIEVNEQFVDEFAPEIVFQPGFFVTNRTDGN